MKIRLRITHVCRHWRTVALECPVLWSRFHVNNGTAVWMAELLARSKQALLSISLSLGSNPAATIHVKAVRLALASLGRIRDLTLKISDPVTPGLEPLLGNPSSTLESLHITLFDNAIPTYTALQPLYHSHHSRLRQLHLSNCPVDWSSISIPTLTDLCIVYNSSAAKAAERLTLDVFLRALTRMPRLETLQANGALAPTTDAVRKSPPALHVQLPYLQEVRLNEVGLLSCTGLLSCIDAPRLSRLYLDIGFQLDDPRSFGELAHAISEHAPSLGVVRTLTVSQPYLGSGGLVLRSYNDAFPHGVNNATHNWVLHRIPNVEIYAVLFLRRGILAAFCDALPFGDVSCLILFDPQGLEFLPRRQPHWERFDIIEHTPSVVELRLVNWRISKGDASMLYQALTPQAGVEMTHHCMLPNLTTLTFDTTDPQNNGVLVEIYGDPMELRRGKEAFIDALRDIFIERYENGMEIERLKLLTRRCHRVSRRISRRISYGAGRLGEANMRDLAEVVRFVETSYVRGTSTGRASAGDGSDGSDMDDDHQGNGSDNN